MARAVREAGIHGTRTSNAERRSGRENKRSTLNVQRLTLKEKTSAGFASSARGLVANRDNRRITLGKFIRDSVQYKAS